tara:strand:- start:32 stop:193 length:162 start_codon:yes stop_codon:yes gene_type:complete
MYNEDLQVEKLKELKGEGKPKRKPPKKKPEQLFDMKKTKDKSKKSKNYKKKGK